MMIVGWNQVIGMFPIASSCFFKAIYFKLAACVFIYYLFCFFSTALIQSSLNSIRFRSFPAVLVDSFIGV